MAARIRIGDADRDRLAVLLREHFTAGRLSMDELDKRLGIVLTAEYSDVAAAVFDDLPPAAAYGLPGAGGLPDARGPPGARGAPGASGVPGARGAPGPAAQSAARGRRVRGRHGQSATPGEGWLP